MRSFLLGLLMLVISACNPGASSTATSTIAISISVDNQTQKLTVLEGTTVQMALVQAGVILNSLDQVSPPSYSVLSEPTEIIVTRVQENFEIEETIIPFTRQTVRNESLPEGQTLLIQPGINGLQQITYRTVIQNGVEISRSIFKTDTVTEAKPEIVMVGVQTPFTAFPIQGSLVYLTAGNAWLMEDNTGNRRPLMTTGDLDGRVFTLSPDSRWLLFTRKAIDKDPAEQINSLWILDTSKSTAEPIYIKAKNIIHYAEWIPEQQRSIAFSTVEPRATAPGWQANNDLYKLVFDQDGVVLQISETMESNSGGIYGWWGSQFSWSPDGKRIAYARPDSIGRINLTEGIGDYAPLMDLIPLQTRSDWAWVPGLSWSPDHRILYTVSHAPKAGLTSDEASPIFDLVALVPEENLNVTLVPRTGMFAYPSVSPVYSAEQFLVAYLQAVFPEQSETSRYRLMIMDRDGSNRQAIFPPEDSPGLEPQKVSWEPAINGTIPGLGVTYQGNLWIVQPATGITQQITGDGSITKIDWK